MILSTRQLYTEHRFHSIPPLNSQLRFCRCCCNRTNVFHTAAVCMCVVFFFYCFSGEMRSSKSSTCCSWIWLICKQLNGNSLINMYSIWHLYCIRFFAIYANLNTHSRLFSYLPNASLSLSPSRNLFSFKVHTHLECQL